MSNLKQRTIRATVATAATGVILSAASLASFGAPSAPPSPAKSAATSAAEAESSTPPPADGQRIAKIVVSGNKKIETEAILEKLGSKVGESLRRDTVRQDILTLHKLNFFDSVQVDFDGGTLTVAVRERPSIQKIVFYGNDQIGTDDLKNLLTIKTYDLYDENLVRESVRKLTKHYEDKGFYLAKVTHEVRYNKDRDMAELLFNVREYEKVRIRKVTILGNKAFSDDQVKRSMRNSQEGGFFSWLTNSGNFKELDFKTDLQYLQYFYLNEGYVRFRHDPPVVTVSEDKKYIYITIRVEEGQKYRVADTEFSGDLLYPKEELEEATILKKGDIFSISKRQQERVTLEEKYQDLGYANVNVVPDMKIDDEKLLVSTDFQFEKGTLVRFGKINIKGNTKTRDKVIRRELKIKEGELYTGTGMRESKENVDRLGYFEPGKIEFTTTSPPGRPDMMDVDIVVKERPTGQFQLGAGYSTVSKFFFTTSVSESNFLGRGQDLRFQASVAADKSSRSFTLSFTDPYAFDSNWLGGVDLYSRVSSSSDYRERREGLGLRSGYSLGEYSRYYVGYRLEDTRISNETASFSQLPKALTERENGTLSSVTNTIAYDKRNNRMEPTGGFYAALSNEFAGLGGNRNFYRTVLDLRYYKRLFRTEDLIMRTKFEMGNVRAWDNNPVQITERFRLGGPDDLKGYYFGVITPKFYDTPVGAHNKAFYILEFEYPLIRDVGLKMVAFYDAGDAFDNYGNITIYQDYGFGFRWFSPLGPLRFEWGYPITKKHGVDRGSQFNFMIGPPF